MCDYRLESNGQHTPTLDSASREKVENYLKLLSKKGNYPYTFTCGLEKLSHPELPPKSAFHSDLTLEGISDDDYTECQKIWRQFEMTEFANYHVLYNVIDVLILADVFMFFRKNVYRFYGLEPIKFYTSSSLTLKAALKFSKINGKRVKLDLLTDKNMYLMGEFKKLVLLFYF